MGIQTSQGRSHFHYSIQTTLVSFAHVSTQSSTTVKAIQCDNGREFDNSSSRTFPLTHGIHLRMTWPYTSPQNGKAERIIRSLNNVGCCLLFQQALLVQPPPQQPASPGPAMDPAIQWTSPGQWMPPGLYNPLAGLPSWDQPSLASTLSTMTMNQTQNNEWYFHSGATSHSGTLSHSFTHHTIMVSYSSIHCCR